MNTEPTNETAYRGGELTQLRRERDLHKAEAALLELQVAQLQHQLDQVRTIREPKPDWLYDFNTMGKPAWVALWCMSVLLGAALFRPGQVLP